MSRIPWRRVWPAGWWFDALLVAGFTAITLLLANGYLLGIDTAVSEWCGAHQPRLTYWLARVGNLLGQGGFFTYACTLLALFWVWRRHTVRPILPVVTAFALTFVSISILKDVTDRAAPRTPVTVAVPHPEQFGSGGVSYPSGHLTNAIVWYGTLAILLSPWVTGRWRWALRIVPPVVLAFTTVYLQFHWVSDTVAGILLGSFLWRLMGRIPWDDLPLPKTKWTGPAGLS